MVLDEVNYAAKLNLISEQDILDIIAARPEKTSLVLTGNYVPESVIAGSGFGHRNERDQTPLSKGDKGKERD